MACVPAYRGPSLEGIGKQASHADFPTPFRLGHITKRHRTATNFRAKRRPLHATQPEEYAHKNTVN